MMIYTWFCEAIILALYIFACLALLEPRCGRTARALACGAAFLCSCAVLAALILSGSAAAALTLLPLIAYLPFSVCVYILSAGGVFEAASACSVGALAALIVKTFKKILLKLLRGYLNGVALDIIIALAVLVLAAAAVFAVFRYTRRTFRACADYDGKNRMLVLIPVATVFLLIFNSLNSTSSAEVMIMTLIIAATFYVISSRLFVYSARIAEAAENERKLSENLSLQRKNFEQLFQTVEAGRLYRHDMRHHLRVLAGMAQQNNSEEILGYIGEISGSAELCESEIYCKNSAVNAVFSEYISRAKKLGCRIKLRIFIPEEFPFELTDVCIILSNALENALNACEKCPEDKRYIDLLADFPNERKLKVSVRNSSEDNVEIGADGLPIVKSRNDGHGIGLRGVSKIVRKYNGFLCCACENGEFMFCAEIFKAPNGPPSGNKNTERKPRRSKALPAVMTALICAVGLMNFSPAAASALSKVLSVEIKTIGYGWGSNSFSAEYPEFSGENSDILNSSAEDFIEQASDIFWSSAIRKYEGYVSEDSGYQIMLDNDKYLSVRFYTTLNIGGSVDYSRCVTLDKMSGEAVGLADLFDEDCDYISVISGEILRQMTYRNENKNASFFLPGGIWSDDECFKEISPDANFYINSDGRLVIVFDEYEVAAGAMGSPEFVMPTEIFG